MLNKMELDKKKITESDFKYTIDRFADIKIMRYRVDIWDKLNLKQKEFIYYLSQSTLAGRDILYAQNFKYNLLVRHILEAIENTYTGDKNVEEYKEFIIYLKKVWLSNGIHHHNDNNKYAPTFSSLYFKDLMKNSDLDKVLNMLSLNGGETNTEQSELANIDTVERLLNFVEPILFDKDLYATRQNLDVDLGLIEASAGNYYHGVSTKEAEEFYAKMQNKDDNKPISYGLNSKLVKRDGEIYEDVYKIGGLYSSALEQVVYYLEKAFPLAENLSQQKHIKTLIDYYKTGDLKIWDEYNIQWVKDNFSEIDYVNGFIETYGDPLGMKASWEANVNIKDVEATKRTTIISENAQWFEDNSPVDKCFKKEVVKGVSAKVIIAIQLGGDCFPTPPIGINLPNADWIRRDYGSKSVTIENITDAYDKSALEGVSSVKEFAFSDDEVAISKEYGSLSGNLHTDLHECLGHGSGQLLDGVNSEALKNYSSVIEETRADLFALYYMMDDKMIELGLIPNHNVGIAEYNSYIRNGLMTQLVRVKLGDDIQQAHMRNRSLIAHWAYERGRGTNLIEKIIQDNKTYFKINNYNKLRTLFGEFLAEVQRIKSEGDYSAAQELVEKYGVKVDRVLHEEVLGRYKALNLATYSGFVNPVLTPIYDGDVLVDVGIFYTDDYAGQMLDYGRRYSFLPLSPDAS